VWARIGHQRLHGLDGKHGVDALLDAFVVDAAVDRQDVLARRTVEKVSATFQLVGHGRAGHPRAGEIGDHLRVAC